MGLRDEIKSEFSSLKDSIKKKRTELFFFLAIVFYIFF